jgi:glycosyltransferase involved in cell wall biosynthesis
MRIIFFAGGSYIGGMEMVTLTLMKDLKAQGHESYAVVSGWNDGCYPAKLGEAGIAHQSLKLGRLYVSKPMWTLDGLVNFPCAARRLRGLIRAFRPEVVVLTGVEFALTVLQVLPKDLPVVLHLHDIPNRLYGTWIGRYVLAKISGIITVSDFIRERLMMATCVACPVRTVRNGVPCFDLPARVVCSKLRIGIIGQVIPRKRHDVLVNAVGLLRVNLRENVEVRIYGDILRQS